MIVHWACVRHVMELGLMNIRVIYFEHYIPLTIC